jgi:cell division protein FtsL
VTSPLRARAAEPRRAPTPSRRPDLRVVDAAPRRRAGRVGTIAGIALFATLFGLAAFQTVLIKNQARIDDLNRRIDAATAETDTLALQVADLESPGRIIAVARERLGMIDPGSVTYLRPGGDDDARALLPAPPPPDPATPDPATPDPAGIDP